MLKRAAHFLKIVQALSWGKERQRCFWKLERLQKAAVQCIFRDGYGYAATSDAYRLTDGRPDGAAAAKGMQSAIEDAGLTKDQINAISAHGTSTAMNDKVETIAIKRALGTFAYAIPVISLKSQVGHSVIAAGALEAVASLLMLSEQRLAPTINYRKLIQSAISITCLTSRVPALRANPEQ